ncbi:MAG: glucose 1-dehydrogenase [Alicyclobacillus macrosporangiidus]|uniref:glucose 1-dehydrogenase n=1 Tax=Alicyclobacillus macrosporangiidus TaxID=392015 RepID=UPI0026EB759D|nr:glucose 1-dehydrogenase [Alicyclobacillus macrosporangiidus]MCL6599903.1 glucose 1-dehydrogenase [Alicyclobacillus macrosporangiidus]
MSEFPTFSLDGRLALVTGGTRGIGLAMARGLAHAGSDVVVLGRDPESGSMAVAGIERLGRRGVFVQADVTQEGQVVEAVERIEREVGPIDILINNAGKNIRKPLTEYRADDWDDVLGTNLRGIFLVGREVIRRMVGRGRGKVINIASIFGGVGMPYQTAYAASKGGIVQLTKVWATEYASRGINVNCLAPAYIRTPMTAGWLEDPDRLRDILSRTPAGRLGEPKDVMGAAVFLASDASDFVHGHVLYVDGGWLAQ